MVQGGRHIRFAAAWAVATVVLSLFPISHCNAQTVVDWQFGLTQAVLSDQYQPWAIGPGTGAGVALSVAEKTRVRLGLSWRRLWDDMVSKNTVKLPHPDSRAKRAWTQTLLTAHLEYLLGGPESLSLFGSAGLGISFWRIESYPDYDAIEITDGDGNPVDYAATEAVLSFALGIQPRLISNLRLRAQLGVDYFTGLGADFADAWNNERSRAQLWLTVGVALPFGRGKGPSVQTHNEIPAPTPAPDTNTATVVQETAPLQVAVDVEATVDADHDGVPDTKDQCPDTPTGAIVDRHGCPLDGDGDGVYDGLDRCPGTVPGLRARVDNSGCPTAEAIPSIPIEKKTVIVTESPQADTMAGESAVPTDTSTASVEATAPTGVAAEPTEAAATVETIADSSDSTAATPNQRPSLSIGTTQTDSDGDRIPDAHDWCPNTLKGLSVDRHGCLIMTQLQRRLILHVSYLPGTTAPDATSLAVLDDLIVRLKRAPEVQVTVEGFTDNIGRDDDNLAVSQKRADRIKSYLVKKGITAARITALGRGEAKFIADNATALGRQKNRRIEISFQRP